MPKGRGAKKPKPDLNVILEGKLKTVEWLRNEVFGIGRNVGQPASNDAGMKKDLIILGFGLANDLAKIRSFTGFNPVTSHMNLVGAVDIAEQLESISKLADLGTLMTERYPFEPKVFKIPKYPKKNIKPSWIFSHIAGHDSRAHLQVANATAFDSLFGTGNFWSSYKPGPNGPGIHPIDQELQKPLSGLPRNTIVLSFDYEGFNNSRHPVHANDLTEVGFSWYDCDEIRDVAPGPLGINWHDYIHSVQYRNDQHRNHRLFSYLVNDPKYFQYGPPQWFNAKSGRAKFEDLFEKLSLGQPVPATNVAGFKPLDFPIDEALRATDANLYPVYDHNFKLLPNHDIGHAGNERRRVLWSPDPVNDSDAPPLPYFKPSPEALKPVDDNQQQHDDEQAADRAAFLKEYQLDDPALDQYGDEDRMGSPVVDDPTASNDAGNHPFERVDDDGDEAMTGMQIDDNLPASNDAGEGAEDDGEDPDDEGDDNDREMASLIVRICADNLNGMGCTIKKCNQLHICPDFNSEKKVSTVTKDLYVRLLT